MDERERLYQALINADKAGDVKAARSLANYIRGLPDESGSRVSQIPTDAPRAVASPRPQAPEDNLLGKITGNVIETPLALATGAISPLIALGIKGGEALYDAFTGKPAPAADTTGSGIMDLAAKISYKPTTQTGRNNLEAIGKFLEASKLEGLAGMPVLNAPRNAMAVAEASNALRSPARAGVASATAAAKNALSSASTVPTQAYRRVENALIGKDAQMAGMGAAATPVELQRVTTAQNLPVPINLTRGQASRDFVQQRFERETAKLPEGEPLRSRFAEQNQQLVKNLEQMADETGMTAPSLRETGTAVDSALRQKMRESLDNIETAYDAARKAGHMSELIDITPLSDFIQKNRSASINAPILRAARSALKDIDPSGSRMVSINDLEELRKSFGAQIEPGTPNAHFGNQMIGMIDKSTKGKGGQLYKDARALYEQYASTFIDKDTVAKITRLKKGSADRAVALEDVFNHAILKGSLDDVRAVQKALGESGKPGEQAWRELQGQTLRHIQDTVTKSATLDVNGNRIVSPTELDRVVRSLDADGKLEFLFGREKAQQIRDLNEVAMHALTSPPGAVNTSNTATVMAMVVDMLGGMMTGLPLPVATTVKVGRDAIRSRALKKKVNASLTP